MPFKLRPFVPEDAPSLAKYANNLNVARNMSDLFPYPYTLQNARDFIAMTGQHQPVRIFAIDINGEAVGATGLHPLGDIFRKNAELGYWLGEPFWGQGIVPRVVGQMVEYGFEHFDITRIFARPFGTNLASQRVLEKAGFKLEARFEKTIFKRGEFLDELVYAVRREG
ncbi:MAG: N-acetyltransferase [Bacteroidetes bacterium]|nr:MAG: N-acetyltransferase [Bacteroidota bacterium]